MYENRTLPAEQWLKRDLTQETQWSLLPNVHQYSPQPWKAIHKAVTHALSGSWRPCTPYIQTIYLFLMYYFWEISLNFMAWKPVSLENGDVPCKAMQDC